ncbi:hypothetical protein GQ43DRAFT_121288 [Delitschia confertaspora ATCC 74209]|uniref:Uncharacterized protein n=1 Tax=Delitschia confertaspora ATCC 74209 TaxID=1513339 RepID=A0A9P4JWI0_9PLEO|nr:hypothetical protein GQ43DRAFT_121288 [Delitschia confertaspora ATCC 74209]
MFIGEMSGIHLFLAFSSSLISVIKPILFSFFIQSLSFFNMTRPPVLRMIPARVTAIDRFLWCFSYYNSADRLGHHRRVFPSRQ